MRMPTVNTSRSKSSRNMLTFRSGTMQTALKTLPRASDSTGASAPYSTSSWSSSALKPQALDNSARLTVSRESSQVTSMGVGDMNALLGLGCARIEVRHLRKLHEEVPFTLGQRARHVDEHVGIQVAAPAATIGHAALAQPQLAARAGACGDREHHRP